MGIRSRSTAWKLCVMLVATCLALIAQSESVQRFAIERRRRAVTREFPLPFAGHVGKYVRCAYQWKPDALQGNADRRYEHAGCGGPGRSPNPDVSAGCHSGNVGDDQQ